MAKCHFAVVIQLLSSPHEQVGCSFSCPFHSMDCSTPGFPVYHQLPELAQTQVHRVSEAIQPSHPPSSPSPPAFNLSQNRSSLHQVAKVLELQLQHRPSKEYSGLISFRMDWFDLLVVQGTLKSLLQHHSSKVPILRRSAFLTGQCHCRESKVGVGVITGWMTNPGDTWTQP